MELPTKRRSLIGQILLYLLARFAYAIVAPIGIIYTWVRAYREFGFKDGNHYMAWKFRMMSLGVDQNGNIAIDTFMNDHARKPEGHKYGNPDETISSATGKNERDGTLKRFGEVVTSFLSIWEYNHSIKWIEEDEH